MRCWLEQAEQAYLEEHGSNLGAIAHATGYLQRQCIQQDLQGGQYHAAQCLSF